MPEEIKIEPNTAKHPDKIGEFVKCKVCLTVYPKQLPRCPVCSGADGPKSGYYLS